MTRAGCVNGGVGCGVACRGKDSVLLGAGGGLEEGVRVASVVGRQLAHLDLRCTAPSQVVNPATCTLHPAPCTLHPAPCTLHHEPHDWYAAPSSSRVPNLNS